MKILTHNKLIRIFFRSIFLNDLWNTNIITVTNYIRKLHFFI